MSVCHGGIAGIRDFLDGRDDGQGLASRGAILPDTGGRHQRSTSLPTAAKYTLQSGRWGAAYQDYRNDSRGARRSQSRRKGSSKVKSEE